MTYTITSAQWANADNTAFVAQTVEAGAVAGEVNGRLHAELLASGVTVASYVAPPDESRRIAKLTIVERLVAAGKAQDAQTALASNASLSLMWGAAPELVPVDREDIRAFLTAIGADPDEVLAP